MRHFLSIADLSSDEVWAILDKARALKDERQKTGAFDMAMIQLGGRALYLSPNEIQLGKRESVADVARVLSRYVDAIMARVFAHRDVEELAAYSRVPVINGLSDFNHPCQGMADLLTIYERYDKLTGLKLAYVGDGNNVAHSLLLGASKTGMHITVATPTGYEPHPAVVRLARTFATESGSEVVITNDPRQAVRDADVIYTDVWTSMGQEAEAEQRLKVFPPYQVNGELVAQARPEVIVMHCLPAHRGQEITDEVADGPHSVLFDQAENRMHAQKAILVSLLVK